MNSEAEIQTTNSIIQVLPLQYAIEPIIEFYKNIAKDESVMQISLTHRPGKTPDLRSNCP